MTAGQEEGQMEQIYHVFRFLREEGDGARAVTLNILLDKTHACTIIFRSDRRTMNEIS